MLNSLVKFLTCVGVGDRSEVPSHFRELQGQSKTSFYRISEQHVDMLRPTRDSSDTNSKHFRVFWDPHDVTRGGGKGRLGNHHTCDVQPFSETV